MESKHTAVVIVVVSLLSFGWVIADTVLSHQRRPTGGDRNCWPISTSQSTGTIRCWSGGELVYQNSIYHNGGVLCATDGHEIKITGGKSLCVIESNQENVWTPPISQGDRNE